MERPRKDEPMRCHGSAQCEDHEVERLDEITAIMTIHNIRKMASNGALEGFIKDDKGVRYPVMRAPEWEKWYEQKF